MAEYIIEYTKTERVRERIAIDADSPEEALRIVEEYEFDNCDSWETDSIEWFVSDAEIVKE